jgi:hypothetical protein
VSNAQVSVESLEAFKQYSAKKSMALLEDYDDWLSKHEVNASSNTESSDEPGSSAYVTVGIYYLESPKKESEP